MLAKHISEIGSSCAILDSRCPRNSISFAISSGGTFSASIRTRDGQRFDPADFDAVWYRLKPVIPGPAQGPLEASGSLFAQGEWRTVLRSLSLCTPKARWVNPLDAQMRIGSKLRQLELATKVGFSIPDTLISNDPDAVQGLFALHPCVIYKALNGFVFSDQTGILTNKVTQRQVKDRSEGIRRAPGIFQNLIEKDHELRITVVGETIFPAKVRTPKTGPGAIDWRHAHFEDIFETCTLDEVIADQIRLFHRTAGLGFGAYDFIVDRKGAHYFLECNAAGQFLWLEFSLGLPIMDALANLLCGTAFTATS